MQELQKIVKQLVLDKTIFKAQHRINVEEFNKYFYHSNVDIEALVLRELSNKLSTMIVNNEKDSIVKEETHNFTDFKLELLVLNPSLLKTIVEAVIIMLPDYKIKEIKNGENRL